MIKLFLFACATTMMVSCGVMQQLVGIVVDKRSKKPVAGVMVKRLDYRETGATDTNGYFQYFRYGSGAPITLDFEKEGYKNTSLTFKGFNQVRLIQLDSINAQPSADIQMPEKQILAWIMFGDPEYNVDSVHLISKFHFNNLIDFSIHMIQTKSFDEITAEQHVVIMRCFNTANRRLIKSERMWLLAQLVNSKKYMNGLVNKYYDRGMDGVNEGMYFAKLKMQLHGGKRKWPYAYYKVTKKG